MTLKTLFKEGFSKAWHYYIWIVVLVRLLIPYSPEYGLINDLFKIQWVHNISIATNQSLIGTDVTAENTSTNTNYNTPQTGNNFQEPSISETKGGVLLPNGWELAGFTWLAGILLLLLIRMIQYLHFTHLVRRGADPIADKRILSVYKRIAQELGIKNRPRIFFSEQIISPMLIGLMRPTIFLTDTVITMEEESLSYVFRHELMHFKRHDLWYKWCSDLTLCIHWFNPLVYVMSRQINSQCEISCDEAVAKDLNMEERQIYGNVLLNAASENINYQHQVLSTTLYEDKKSLKERIKSIMKAKRKSKKTRILSVVAAIVICTAAFMLGTYTINGAGKTNNDTLVSAVGDNDKSASPDAPSDSSVNTDDANTDNSNLNSSNTDDTSTGDTNTESSNNSTETSDTNVGSTEDIDNTDSSTNNTGSSEEENDIIYTNTKYGFQFTLPESWKDYTLQTEEWQGTALTGENISEVVEVGPKISIRHPKWTTDNPHQDIPIMIFTVEQWDIVLKEEIAVSAAPIGPSKIGSNSKYVFAIPARYNFAYPTGYEEVEKILENNPLIPNEIFE
jgi:beta-lactamase regulating signal transducer with metallopeptidase domain